MKKNLYSLTYKTRDKISRHSRICIPFCPYYSLFLEVPTKSVVLIYLAIKVVRYALLICTLCSRPLSSTR